MPVSHLLDNFFVAGSRWFVEQGGAGFGELALFRQGRGSVVTLFKITRFDVRVRGVVVRLRFNSVFEAFVVSRPPSSHCSHIRRMSLEYRVLCCVPPLSRRKTSFGRHRRSVQARVSLCEVTPDKAAR